MILVLVFAPREKPSIASNRTARAPTRPSGLCPESRRAREAILRKSLFHERCLLIYVFGVHMSRPQSPSALFRSRGCSILFVRSRHFPKNHVGRRQKICDISRSARKLVDDGRVPDFRDLAEPRSGPGSGPPTSRKFFWKNFST